MAYSTISKPSLYFNTLLYTGNGNANNAITGVGFTPDFVWQKRRDGGIDHVLFDKVRGATKVIQTGSTGVEQTSSSNQDTQSLDSDGFTVGTPSKFGGINANGGTSVAWNWKANGAGSSNSDGSITSTVSANTTAGFSVVTYTGTGSTATVGHGLGVKPDIVIYKERNNTNAWRVMHDINGTLKRIYLNTTAAEASIIDSSTAPTNTLLNIGTGSEVNRSSGTFVAYCFASKRGYSKFSSYTGNGDADGAFIYTGFKPAFIIIKESSNARDWIMVDNKRDVDNVVSNRLFPNGTSAQNTNNDMLDFTSNGFKIRNSNTTANNNGGTYIYMAIAEEPLVANVGASIPATAR